MLRIIWIPALLVCAAGAHAQNISTIAGSTFVFPESPLPAIQAPLGQVWAVALDKAGNYYVADTSNSIVVKISASGTLTIVAGNGTFGYSGDGGPATSAALDYPYGIAVDGAGNLYIADTFSCVIRMVNTSGVITTVAGNYANAGYSGDGGQATNAGLSAPYGVAVDAAGNLYIADEGNNVIRKVDTDGIITTVAGNGTGGESGDGGPPSMPSCATRLAWRWTDPATCSWPNRAAGSGKSTRRESSTRWLVMASSPTTATAFPLPAPRWHFLVRSL